MMKIRLLLASAAASLLALAGTASADGLYNGGPPIGYAEPFRWTGCYAGGNFGGAWASKALTDPVQLVQDQILGAPSTTGVTTVNTNPTGFVFGGQIGCDYQFASNWVIGVEGGASATTLKGSSTVSLPLGNPGDQANVTARADILPSITGRLGYAVDTWLLYAKGGAAWAGDSYSVAGTFQGTPFNFQGLGLRTGWTVGAGIEKSIRQHWSVRLEYDYFDFGHANVLMSDNNLALSGNVDAKQTVQTVRFGLNFHPW
jgi:outer membrane immunogenic protein